MATVVITNVSGDPQDNPLLIQDLYTSVAVGSPLTVVRAASDLPRMKSLQAAMTAGKVTVTITPSADELGSGLLNSPDSVGGADIEEVAATDYLALTATVRVAMSSGGSSGTADDVTVYGVNTLPFKCRVVDAWAVFSTAAGASTVTIRSASGGAGTLVGTLDSGSAGRVPVAFQGNATTVLTPGSSVGLFLRRSDRSVVGEVFLTVRRES